MFTKEDISLYQGHRIMNKTPVFLTLLIFIKIIQIKVRLGTKTLYFNYISDFIALQPVKGVSLLGGLSFG